MLTTTHEHSPAGHPITLLSLARPEKRNALTPALLAALTAAINEHHARSRALIITGEGDHFCAGFDLSLCRDDDRALADLLTGLYDAVAALRDADCPVVIAAHGAAIAGGCALLGGADLAITNTHAKLGYPVARLGISPAITAPFLRAITSDAVARSLLLEGALITGDAATRLGLTSHCVPIPADVLPLARSLAGALADKPAEGIRATRRWLKQLTMPAPSSNTPNDTAAHTLRAGLLTSLSLVGSVESRERLAALWDRR